MAIGGSMGSTAVLRRTLAIYPPGLPATVLLATHVPSGSSGYLAEALGRACPLPVSQALGGQPLEGGHVHVAPPNRHLLVNAGAMVLGTGPRENMARPAIAPLFRSVALAFGQRATGVVLTRRLDGAAAGLHAIKATGGLAVVQHPLDAEAADMPRAALEAVEVDQVGRAEKLGGLIAELVRAEAGPSHPRSHDLELEIAAGRRLGSDRLHEIAEPVALTCPHCQGVLSETKEPGCLRYRCQIGHAFTAEAVIFAGEDRIEEALRIAMRMMEERTELVGRMAGEARQSGRRAVAELYKARAAEYAQYAATCAGRQRGGARG